MTKSFGRMAALALIALAALFSGSSAALADSEPTQSPTPSVSALADDHEPSAKPEPSEVPDFEDDAGHHDELHDQYGNDVDQVFLPPLVVKPGSAPHVGGSKDSVTGKPNLQLNGQPLVSLRSANQVDPAANIPVDLESVFVTDLTPADQFFQAATFGLAVMSVGAVGLGGLALAQRARHRREQIGL